MSDAAGVQLLGGDIDVSDFVAQHADSETPTTGAFVSIPLPAYDALADCIMASAGMVLDGIEHVRLECGLILPLHELDVVEAAELLGKSGLAAARAPVSP